MKRLVITTIILLLATAWVTVLYFKNLNPPGLHTSEVMSDIPGSAAVIFEYTNEQSFYDIFSDNTLLNDVIGSQKLADMDTLRNRLIENPLLSKYFGGQVLFISLHPLKNNDVDLMLTMPAAKGFDISIIDKLAKQQNNGLIISSTSIKGVPAYSIYISSLKKRFYVVNKGDNIFSGSFSEELAEESAADKKPGKKNFVPLSARQNASSLANLYVNYEQLNPIFQSLFKNNTDLFKSFRLLPAMAAMSLDYKTDAFMFNGITTIQLNEPQSYLTLFAAQQPVINQLKDIFPSTTAYSCNFSVSDPLKFASALSQWQIKGGLEKEKNALFDKVKAGTGVNLKSSFYSLLGNEFAIVTTRYEEKYAIISVKDGEKMQVLMMNISNRINDNTGQFNFDKLPFFLLGDAFTIFKHPYFMVEDNYLVLANSSKELASYYDSYLNRKFLNKTDAYNQFNDLLSERSNVSFFINFKAIQPLLKRDMQPGFYDAFEKNVPGWKDFYAASYQFSAADKNFYTNFCMKLNNIDSAAVKTGISGDNGK
jgi:hypothetical protein